MSDELTQYPKAGKRTGWYLCENTPGVVVTVYNARTARKVKVMENVLGGLCANMQPGQTYWVAATIAGKTAGYYTQCGVDGPGPAYNHFTSSKAE